MQRRSDGSNTPANDTNPTDSPFNLTEQGSAGSPCPSEHGSNRAPPLKPEAVVRRRWSSISVRVAGLAVVATAMVATVAIGTSPPERRLEVSTEAGRSGSAATLLSDRAIGEPIPPGRRLDDTGPGWRGIAASTGAYAALAVWSESQVYVSRDDGVAFHQVLGGPGAIGGVAIDAQARLYVVRDRRALGTQDADGLAEWLPLPFTGDTVAIAAENGWLCWLATAHDGDGDASLVLAASPDHGLTWRRQTFAGYATDAAMRIEPDGAIHLILHREDSADETMWRLAGHVDGRPPTPMPWPTSYANAWGLGHGGWAYAIASECADEGNDVCAAGPAGAAFHRAGATPTWNLLVASDGATTLAVSGDQLFGLEGARMRTLDRRAPPGISALAIDGIGRALGTVGPYVVRWSAAHGWRVLFSRSGTIEFLAGAPSE